MALVAAPSKLQCPHYAYHESCLKKSKRTWVKCDLSRSKQTLFLEYFLLLVIAWVFVWDIVLERIPNLSLSPIARLAISLVLLYSAAIIGRDIQILTQARAL